MAMQKDSTPEERAAKRVEDFAALAWHVATYLIINTFLWLIVPEAAFWVTLGWGIGLAFHIAHYVIGDDVKEGRRYRRYLEEERAAEKQDSF